MTTAWLFAGQGVEPPWIDASLVARPASRPLVEAASDACGEDVARLLVGGGPALARVEVLQPALVAACLMAAAALAEVAPPPLAVCGHSLGEVTAWAASGAVAPADAIAAAGVRGRLMAREAALHPGGMAALTSSADVARAIACGAVVAAENAPNETVVSGDRASIATVLATAAGKRIPVAGAWHSPAMAGAVDELRAALEAVPRQDTPVAFVANRDGAVADGADVPRLLAEQLVHPIRWTAALRTLRELGVARYVVAGPGRLVRSLLRTNLGEVDIVLVERERDLARVLR